MDRNEAMLRELNLYPLWVRRNMPAPVVAEQHVPIEVEQSVPATAERAEQPAAVNIEQIENREPAIVLDQEVQATSSGSEQPAVLAQRNKVRQSTIQQAGCGVDTAVPLHDWPQLKEAVRDCTACKLRAGCTQTVFGVGDEKADWLFVGEGPGADEDALGEPFVGQAGKLLDNMLMSIKLKRGENVYIANIVKCRPPGNRNPDPEEIATCLPYLQRQIELIRPKLIVALGKVASNALLGKDATLASLRGKLHDYQGIPLVVTYHPAYLLRSPSEKAKAWQDLCLAESVRDEVPNKK